MKKLEAPIRSRNEYPPLRPFAININPPVYAVIRMAEGSPARSRVAVYSSKVVYPCTLITNNDRLRQRITPPFGGLYKLKKELGQGSQGQAWLVCGHGHEHKDSPEDYSDHYAVKIYKEGENVDYIIREAEMYLDLWQTPDLKGLARYHNFLSDRATKRTGLVLDYVGTDLDVLFAQCRHTWSISTVAQIWLMLLDGIEALHNCGYILRYIKGANLCMGGDDKKTLFIIDLSLAKKYLDSDGHHLPFQFVGHRIGNMAYTSRNSDKRMRPSRRDDLESAAFAMLCFINGGSLPWSEWPDLDYKGKISNEQLSCGYPALKQYFDYVSNLTYEGKPDYDFLRTTIRTLIPASCDSKTFEWLTEDEVAKDCTKNKRKAEDEAEQEQKQKQRQDRPSKTIFVEQ